MTVFLVSLPLMLSAPVAAQGTATSGSDRLFLGFAQEATVVDGQWWEGQVEIADGDPADKVLGRVVFALQPLYQLEVGGRVGFGSTDTDPGFPDGSGATDFDGWVKYYLGTVADDTEFAVGGVLTVPTGDDTAGLGEDAFAVGLFGSFRHRLPQVLLSGYVGARYNQDGKLLGADLEGKGSVMAGFGVLFPISDEVTLVGEATYETDRFDNTVVGGHRYDGADFRVLGGVNWRITNRGMLRAGIGFGFADGVPDSQVFAGYAVSF